MLIENDVFYFFYWGLPLFHTKFKVNHIISYGQQAEMNPKGHTGIRKSQILINRVK